VIVVWGVGQLLESYVLTPKLVGDRVGLSPVTVVFSVMTGGTLFGFLGMLLALPVAAVANVLIRHMHGQYATSRFYLGDESHALKIEIATAHHSREADAAEPTDPA
jgi:predicted PurR-regulated permease PerM